MGIAEMEFECIEDCSSMEDYACEAEEDFERAQQRATTEKTQLASDIMALNSALKALGEGDTPVHKDMRRRIKALERKYGEVSGVTPRYKAFSSHGKPVLCTANMQALFDFLEIEVEYDGLGEVRRLRSPRFERNTADGRPVFVTQDVYMPKLRSLAVDHGLPVVSATFTSIVNAVIDPHRKNLRREWLLSQPWDGVDRIPQLLSTLVIQEAYREFTPLYHEYVYRWFIGAAKAGLLEMNLEDSHGHGSDGMLVLTGSQNAWKTDWVGQLLPNPQWVLRGEEFDPCNRDFTLRIGKYWIVELGEINDSLRMANIEQTKRWITQDTDDVRGVYAEESVRRPRRTVTIGTVNHERFLVDPSENRRFWVIPVEKCLAKDSARFGVNDGPYADITPLEKLPLQQVWAQFAHLAQQDHYGTAHKLPAEFHDLRRNANRMHTKLDVLERMELTVDVTDTKAETAAAIAQALHPVEQAILDLFEYVHDLPLKQMMTARDVANVISECSNVLSHTYPNVAERHISKNVAQHLDRMRIKKVMDPLLHLGRYALKPKS
jgi:hypothetical protein